MIYHIETALNNDIVVCVYVASGIKNNFPCAVVVCCIKTQLLL